MSDDLIAAPPGQPAAATRPADPSERLRVLLVTGLSGAGHSTALNLLEDLGWEAVDNLPLALLGGVTGDGTAPQRPIAIGVDSRTRDFSPDALLAAVRGAADLVIDTSDLAIADLKHLLTGHFALDRQAAAIAVTSFSYRRGLPREADLVFDVRFLRNPYYEPGLKGLSGRDPEVAAFIEQDPAFTGFFAALTALLAPLLPRYEREGKSYLTLAVGCTGGRHRSVYVAERLAAWLRRQGRLVGLRHRDLGLDSLAG